MRFSLWHPAIFPKPCSCLLTPHIRCSLGIPAFRQEVAKDWSKEYLMIWILCCRLQSRHFLSSRFLLVFCFRWKWAVPPLTAAGAEPPTMPCKAKHNQGWCGHLCGHCLLALVLLFRTKLQRWGSGTPFPPLSPWPLYWKCQMVGRVL